MARYATWGIWNPELLVLIRNIVEDTEIACTKKEVYEAIFETVIPTCLEAASNYNVRLLKEREEKKTAPLFPREEQLGAYKESLGQLLPSLADALGKTQAALSLHVNEFIQMALVVVSDHETLDYLLDLKFNRIQEKSAVITSLYGNALPKELLPGLQYNDPEVLSETTKRLCPFVQGNCTVNIQPRILAHLEFLEAIDNNLATPTYKQFFESRTQKSMEDYKADFAEENASILSTVPLSPHLHQKINTTRDNKSRFSCVPGSTYNRQARGKDAEKEKWYCSCVLL